MARTFIPRPDSLEAFERVFDMGAFAIAATGPPGCGKSALVAGWLGAGEEPGVAVPLADAVAVEGLVAQVSLGLGLEVGGADEVGRALKARGPFIVVLDDFDRLVGVGEAQIAAWGDVAPQVRWVVTSRQRPELRDCAVVDVGVMTPEQALALFEHRAREVRPDFVMDDEVRSVVAKLAEQLDHVPLALELAAARVTALGPAEILARLPQRFRILRGKGKTLQGAIGLSWELLDAWERAALAQCVVFRGGFTAAAAEDIIDMPDDAPWSVDLLQQLVEKSLLRSYAAPELAGELRFEMLTSIREFVVGEAPPSIELTARHAAFYLASCRGWTYQMRRADGAEARKRVEQEQPNLLAAFAGARDDRTIVELALTLDKTFRLYGPHETWERVLSRAAEAAVNVDELRPLVHRALGELHLLRGRFDFARTELDLAAADATTSQSWVVLAWTLFLTGEVERRRGNPESAHRQLQRAIELARAHQIDHLERTALGHAAGCLVDLGDQRAAREALEQMSRIPPSVDLRDEATLLKRVAYAQHYLGNTEEQARLTTDALALAQQSGDQRMVAICTQGLGDAAFAAGDFETARARWESALTMHRLHGSAEFEGALLGNMGNLDHREDRLESARRAYREALRLHAASGAKPYEAVVWFGLGVLEFEQQNYMDAYAALDRSAALNDAMGNVSDFASCLLVQAWVDAARGESAKSKRAQAHQAFVASGDADWAALALSDAPHEVSDATVRACVDALRGEPADRSRLHVRAAMARFAEPAPSRDRVDLRVAADANWFEAEGERVNMRRRRAPRHILAQLVAMYESEPGEALDVEQAFAVGWPGEIATVDAANDRVYWAIRTLRKLGLEDVLVTGGDGYLLNPDATIVIE